MVLSFACTCRLSLLTPGSSTMATKSSSCANTLIGGYGPLPVVVPLSQSLANWASSARWRLNKASNGSLNAVIMACTPSTKACGKHSGVEVGSLGILLKPFAAIDWGGGLALSRGECYISASLSCYASLSD